MLSVRAVCGNVYGSLIEQICSEKYMRKAVSIMAKRVHLVRLILVSGGTRMIQVKTKTDRYILAVIKDLRLPEGVVRWEVL